MCTVQYRQSGHTQKFEQVSTETETTHSYFFSSVQRDRLHTEMCKVHNRQKGYI